MSSSTVSPAYQYFIFIEKPGTQNTFENNFKVSHCRFCAEPKKCEDLMDLTRDFEQYQQLKQILDSLKMDFVDILHPLLPKMSCMPCYEALYASFAFFEKAKQSQVDLNSLYSVVDVKTEPVEDTFSIELEQLETKNGLIDETENTTEIDSSEMPAELVEVPMTFEMTQPEPAENIATKCQKINNNMVKMTPITSEQLEPADQYLDSTDSESDSGSKKLPPTYCGIPVFDGLQKDGSETECESWSSYLWSCRHCNIEFDTMDELRGHSKELHGICYAFNCMDCKDQFNTFHSFIEHVRQHRYELRHYCQYCNAKFEGHSECTEHTLTHWAGTRKICDLCGEVCADSDALKRHKKLYKPVGLPKHEHRKRPQQVAHGFTYGGLPVYQLPTATDSWQDYPWTCQECCIRKPDAESLRRHAQEFHNKCFTMKCVDCLKVVRNYRIFATHVTGHRPYLKHYCPYCDTRFEETSELTRHVADHMASDRKPCDGCGQIFANNTELLEHMKKYDPPRQRGTLTTEDLTCDVCHKSFTTMGSRRAHKKIHDGNRQREHVCDICGKSFYNATMLQCHSLSHSAVKSEVCKFCKKAFFSKRRLALHVRSHTDLKLFTCDECGKSFRTKGHLKNHLLIHTDLKPFKCLVCRKQFKYRPNLKTHMNQHTGLRPYFCECCDRTFANWSNCNKHMIRKHGVSFAKTKLTAQGRLDINKETGKVENVASDKNTAEWMRQVIKPLKRGKPFEDLDKLKK